jgi:dolichol-phosphate mannosyltransferase
VSNLPKSGNKSPAATLTPLDKQSNESLERPETIHPVEDNKPGYTSLYSPTIELSVIVPTYNERENINELIRRLQQVLKGRNWEVVFVDDDSPDGTAELVREIARHNKQVRLIHRIGRRGLSSACIEGMISSSAPYVAVIDADMQHDEDLLSSMLDILRNEEVDIVSGSRYMEGGSTGDWRKSRAGISKLATGLSRIVLHANLTDPMSGFFMIRRDVLAELVQNLSGIGFKIMLDIFASSPKPLRFKELPYEFRTRQAGESKLNSMVVWEYFMLLLDKRVGHIIPVRFIPFALIGGLGVGVHMLVVGLLLNGLNMGFTAAQSIATIVAMTGNFAMNNLFTYRDKRLHGWEWLRGWASFSLICGIGAIGNVGIASFLFYKDITWAVAAIAGIIVGAVWNYAVTAAYTWNKPKS